MSEEIEIGLRQKLRESFISGEPDAFTDEALLELLLGYALSRGNPEPLARKLIQEFGGRNNVLSSDFDALCRVKGVKSYTATLLKLAGYLCSSGLAEDLQRGTFRMPQKGLIESQQSSDQKPILAQQEDISLIKKNTARPKSDLFTNSVLKEAIEVLFTYDLDLSPFRTLCTDRQRAILLLPGERSGERIRMFGSDDTFLPVDLIASDHLWILR
jgi:hypothetical protein